MTVVSRKRTEAPDPVPPPAILALPPERMPRHVAIIMDGNGRWARERGLPRVRGHQEGIQSVREVTEESARLRLEQLTLYAFSIENWKRPRYETATLMRFLRRYLVRERREIQAQNIRFRVIGDVAGLPKAVQREMEITIRESADNTGLLLCLALNYGGRSEILQAVRRLAEEAAAGRLDPSAVDERVFESQLWTAGMRDPDLLIRTAGEQRLSNFLLWQLSYTELWTTPVCWPEFRRENLWEAILEYARRRRKFGGLPEGEA